MAGEEATERPPCRAITAPHLARSRFRAGRRTRARPSNPPRAHRVRWARRHPDGSTPAVSAPPIAPLPSSLPTASVSGNNRRRARSLQSSSGRCGGDAAGPRKHGAPGTERAAPRDHNCPERQPNPPRSRQKLGGAGASGWLTVRNSRAHPPDDGAGSASLPALGVLDALGLQSLV